MNLKSDLLDPEPERTAGLSRRASRAQFRSTPVGAALGAIATVAFGLAAAAAAEVCICSNLSVKGSAAEIAVAHEAADRVAAYFTSLGVPFDPQVSIVFVENTKVQSEQQQDEIFGSYQPARKTIHLVKWTTPKVDNREAWGILPSPELLSSMATHELAHAGLWEALQREKGILDAAWQELFAYAVQFEVMNPTMRSQILSRFEEVTPFDAPDNVNSITYALDPALFGIRSYLFVRDRGGATFLSRLVRGSLDFNTFGTVPAYP